MSQDALSWPETKIQVTGITRLAERTGLFLLLLFALIIMVAWLGFATKAETKALSVEAQTLQKEAFNLKRYNLDLLEKVSEACISAEVYGYFYTKDWEVLARGP